MDNVDAGRLADKAAEAVERIIEARPDHHITLVSALAPGADLIATTKALAILEAARRPHRLLVPSAVRFRDDEIDQIIARPVCQRVIELDLPPA